MEENDVDRYLKESSRSYKHCQIKNYARRNSLQKRTMGIETERRIAQSELSREEKQLRSHLKKMQIDQMKHSILHTLREREHSKLRHDDDDDDDDSDNEHTTSTETYKLAPLMYSPSVSPKSRRKKSSLDERGKQYAQRRGRRVSKEFEDLDVDTKTGKLVQPFNVAKRILSTKSKLTASLSLSPNSSPRSGKRSVTPLSPRMRFRNYDHSDGSSSSPISSIEDLHWIGDPEATKSVRRNKKTIEEQELSSELHKLHKK